MHSQSSIQLLFFLLVGFLVLSFVPNEKMQFLLTKENVESYRNSPIKDPTLLNIIAIDDCFINQNENPYIADAIIEHHLIGTIENGNYSTYIVFEYFFLEGLDCTIKAVTINQEKEIQSVLRLAEYSEYPDGVLHESSILHNDVTTRTTVVQGLQSYNDSLDMITMKIDSTIITYRMNRFQRIEQVDSIFKHFEYPL